MNTSPGIETARAACTVADNDGLSTAKPLRRNWREVVFYTLCEPSSSQAAYFISFYFDALVALSMVAMCSETVEGWADFRPFWWTMEIIISSNFALDFVAKLITAQPSLRAYTTGRATFWIDIVALAPFVLELIISLIPGWNPSSNVRSLRVLRLLRFFRLGRIAYENFPDVRLFIQAVRRSRLAIAFLGMYVFGAGLAFASLIYFAETSICELKADGVWYYLLSRKEQDANSERVPCAVQNIFEAWWFTLVTMTTVGYGDVVVRSPVALMCTVGIMITSLVFLALPAAIFAANLTEMYLERRLIRKFREHHREEKEERGAPALNTPSPVGSEQRRDLGTVSPVSDSSGSSALYALISGPSSSRPTSPVVPEASAEQVQELLASVEQANEEINSALGTLSTHITFIQHQQQQLQGLLHRAGKRANP